MNRGKFKDDFVNELLFFGSVANRDLESGLSIEQVEDEFIKFCSSFYGARLDFDEYAVKKSYFIAMHASELINGHINQENIEALCDDIEEEEKIRVGKP